MIPRYAREQMVSLWSDETKYRIHFEIEAHAADALAELSIIPKDAAAAIWKKGRDAKFDVARIEEIEEETRHETLAFLTHLAEIVGPEARFVHQGMTSSDVLDTTLSVQLVRATDILIADVEGQGNPIPENITYVEAIVSCQQALQTAVDARRRIRDPVDPPIDPLRPGSP